MRLGRGEGEAEERRRGEGEAGERRRGGGEAGERRRGGGEAEERRRGGVRLRAADTPAWHNRAQEVYQFACVLLLAVVEVHAIAGLADAQGTDVGAVLQEQLLQVEERLLVADLERAAVCGTSSAGSSCKSDTIKSAQIPSLIAKFLQFPT